VEAIGHLIEALSWHLRGRTEENHYKSQDSLCPGRESNQAPPEYKSEAVPLEPRCAVPHLYSYCV
jgi:hypothetical protein